jgi:hypothetical protein
MATESLQWPTNEDAYEILSEIGGACPSLRFVCLYVCKGDGISSAVVQALCKPLNINVAIRTVSDEQKVAQLQVGAHSDHICDTCRKICLGLRIFAATKTC